MNSQLSMLVVSTSTHEVFFRFHRDERLEVLRIKQELSRSFTFKRGMQITLCQGNFLDNSAEVD